MNQVEPRIAELVDSRTRRDLHETVRMNLALIGVVLTEAQLDGLVRAFIARLDAEVRIRQLSNAGTAPSPAPSTDASNSKFDSHETVNSTRNINVEEP